jgi:hypothetical protein
MSTPSLRPLSASPTIDNNSKNNNLSMGAIVGIIVGSSIFICCTTLLLFYLRIKMKQSNKKSLFHSHKSSKSMKESHEYIYRESLLNENDQRYGRSSLVKESKRSSANLTDHHRVSVELSPNILAVAAINVPSPSAQRSEIGVDQAIDYGRESMEAQHNRYNDNEGIGSLTVMVVKKGDRIEVVEDLDMTSRDSILCSTITDNAPTPVDSYGNSLEERMILGDSIVKNSTHNKTEEHPSSDMYNMEISREDVINRYSINEPKATETTKDSKSERMSQRETEVLFAYHPAAPKL